MYSMDSITTERLLLRPFAVGDAEDVLALMSDDYTCRMAGIPPFRTLADAEAFMAEWRFGAYAVTGKGDGRVIGVVQVSAHVLDGFAELGYWLAEDCRGRGYMTEALEALKETLFGCWWCDELRIKVFVGNEASRRVALKCGFHPVYEAYRDCVYSLYGRVESEECFSMTAGEYEWELRGEDSFSTDAPGRAA